MKSEQFNNGGGKVDRHKQGTPYPLRIPQDMRAQLNLIAVENGRSLHGEIVQRLKESLRREAKCEEAAQ